MFLSDLDVIDRAHEAIFEITTRSGLCVEQAVAPSSKSRVVPEFLSGTAGKAGADVSKDAFRTI
jgi:hypothetical protein